jgi:hypothetical protein
MNPVYGLVQQPDVTIAISIEERPAMADAAPARRSLPIVGIVVLGLLITIVIILGFKSGVLK